MDYNVYGVNGGRHLILECVPGEDLAAYVYYYHTQGWTDVHGVAVCDYCGTEPDIFNHCACEY